MLDDEAFSRFLGEDAVLVLMKLAVKARVGPPVPYGLGLRRKEMRSRGRLPPQLHGPRYSGKALPGIEPARNLDDLRRMVHELTARGVRIEFTKEGLVFTGEDAPMSKLLLSVMGAFAEFERALIRERQREGIELAKKRGVYKGRKQKLPADKRKELRRRASGGERKAALAREFGISRETLYQYLRENHGVGEEYQKTDFH